MVFPSILVSKSHNRPAFVDFESPSRIDSIYPLIFLPAILLLRRTIVMKMTKTFLTAALGLVGLATPIVAGVVYEGPAEKVGCYKGNGTLVMTKDYGNENSMGKCRTTCVEDDVQGGGKGYAVLGLTGPNYCLCGNKLPNNAYKVSDKYCGSSCPSYNQEVCKL